MSDVVAGPPPDRVWAVRFQDGGGWRLIGNPETMRALRARGQVHEEREYMPVAGIGHAVPMSEPLAQSLGYGASPDALELDEPEDPDVAAALARTRYAGALPLGLAKGHRRRRAVTRWLIAIPPDWGGADAAGEYVTTNERIADDARGHGLAVRELTQIEPNGPTPGPAATDEVGVLGAVIQNGMLQRQRDDATAEVARLASRVVRTEAERMDPAVHEHALRGAEAQAGRLRERIAGLQDDLERREAALGRAMRLAHALWDRSGSVSVGPEPSWITAAGTRWPDVVRWVSDAQGGERDGNEQGGAAQEQAPPTAQGPEPPEGQGESRGLAHCDACGNREDGPHQLGCPDRG